MNRFLALSAVLALALVIAACGGKNKELKEGPLAVSAEDLGPNTANALKGKPKGLPGDKQNARYTNETLHGEDDGGT